jgi:cytochrome b involved in lipid metabolism
MDFHTSAAARTRIHKGKLFPVYSKAEVESMASDNRVIISYDDGVYDLTSFAHHHPGGPMIMMANGGPVEYFWAT